MSEQRTQPNPAGAGRMNAYVCPDCSEVTVAVHEEDPPGVTPFLVGCRATSGCKGLARSSFYPKEIPNPAPPAHIHWFRPTTRAELRSELKRYPRRVRAAMKEHFDKGGSLSRERE